MSLYFSTMLQSDNEILNNVRRIIKRIYAEAICQYSHNPPADFLADSHSA